MVRGTRRALVFIVSALMVTLTACRPQPASSDEASSIESGEDVYKVTATINVEEDFEMERVEGVAGSQRALATMRRECAGFIGDAPDLFLRVTDERVLRLQATPTEDHNADLVLAAMSNSGTVLCSDDADGLDPRLESRFSPGQYRIWVGAYAQGEEPVYALTVADVERDLPEGPEPQQIKAGAYGGLAIAPDTGPASLRGRGGGTREAHVIGPGCVGFIAMAPDHILTLEHAMRLRVSARATDADLVLLLRDSEGRVLCNDDADGRNPEIYDELEAGTWSVYVGSYEPSHYPEYVLRVSR